MSQNHKYPCLNFYVGDWLKDPAVMMLSPAPRGIWFDWICVMHEQKNGGKLVANLEQLARMGRCSTAEALQAVTEITKYFVADVYETDGSYEIINRRMQRAHELSEKRKEVGSKGGANAQANREQKPEYEDESEGILRVREFSKGEGISFRDSDWFFWKCVGNGWTNGGKPIKDWKATLRSWNRARYLPSQKPDKNGARPDTQKPIDKSKIDVPERFKAWVADRYPDQRDQAMRWQTWADVPQNGLRDEWWSEVKKGTINL